jgi:hypothetical protein
MWVHGHVIVGLFNATSTFGVAMTTHVNDLLSLYNLLEKLIAYVKDKGDNMSTLAQALTSIISMLLWDL